MTVEERLFRHVIEDAAWSPFSQVVVGLMGKRAAGGIAMTDYMPAVFEKVGERTWANAEAVDFRGVFRNWGVIDGIYLAGVTTGGLVRFASRWLERPFDALGVDGPLIRKGMVRVTLPRHLGPGFAAGLARVLFEGAAAIDTIDRGTPVVGIRGTSWRLPVTFVYERGHGRNTDYVEFPEVVSEGPLKAGTHVVLYDGPQDRVIAEAPLNKPVSLRTGSSVVISPGHLVLRFL